MRWAEGMLKSNSSVADYRAQNKHPNSSTKRLYLRAGRYFLLKQLVSRAGLMNPFKSGKQNDIAIPSFIAFSVAVHAGSWNGWTPVKAYNQSNVLI